MLDLQVYNLREVLSTLPMPPNCPANGVSSKWRCVIAPNIDDENYEESLVYFSKGIPCKLQKWRADETHKGCEGDAFDFISDERWNNFPKPKIAFKAGWAGPGTEQEDNDYHGLVTSFTQVIDGKQRKEVPIEGTDDISKVEESETLNLQMFHRSDTSFYPQIPTLANELLWPEYLMDGAVCDNATRVSQRGAVTWWHLDDCGEFVMQTGLPIRNKQCLTPVSESVTKYPGLMEQNNHPVKLFIYGPPDSYDWFIHDDEADISGKIACLNIFNCPDEHLPDASMLPIVSIAILEAGGRPLVSPPNIPHVVVTLNDCVMVEQRRVSNLFLDEVSYLLQKLKYWKNNPVIYGYINETLQDENVVCGEIIPSLIMRARHFLAEPDSHSLLLVQRMVASLYAISSFPKHYNVPDTSRSSLRATLSSDPFSSVLTDHFRTHLDTHWSVRRFWAKPGFVMCLKGDVGNIDVGDKSVPPSQLLTVIYRNASPIYGPTRLSLDRCLSDYNLMMKLHGEELIKFLRHAKNEDRELLDNLF